MHIVRTRSQGRHYAQLTEVRYWKSMITVLSPAKTLDYDTQKLTKKHSLPEFLDDSQELIDQLAKMTKPKVGKLMGISDKLAELNVSRYKSWQTPFTTENAKQSLLAFKGDVYQGFQCDQWKAADFTFAQKHLRILSGLYGLLRPLDLMQPYRLEMGTKLKTKRGRDLYDFWGDSITESLNVAIKTSRSTAFVNLASNEYFSSVNAEDISVPIVTPVFKDEKNGKYKIISFFAKKARGLMANWIIEDRVKEPAELKKFKVGGYKFAKAESSDLTLTFLRKEGAT